MNTNRLLSATLLASITFGGAAAMAQAADPVRAEKMQAQLQKRFAAADANGDGRLTREEAKDKMPMVYKHFDEIDTAHSGSVSLADIAAYARAHRGERKSAP